MPEQTTQTNKPSSMFPGLDPEATPIVGVGLGVTGLMLSLKPRFAAVPLALTALTALLYRDPERATPQETDALFAPADGTVIAIDEYYEHRFLHTDALRIAILLSPIDVPINRSPASGTVRYFEHIAGEHRPVQQSDAAERNSRTYIGIETDWGPVMLVQIAGPLSRRIVSRVEPGARVGAGERLSTARFGSRTDLLVQRDSIKPLIQLGQHLTAGKTRIAHVTPV